MGLDNFEWWRLGRDGTKDGAGCVLTQSRARLETPSRHIRHGISTRLLAMLEFGSREAG